MADGGSLFLDEIGEIPLDLQSKLLRILQEGQFERVGEERTRKIDVRVIAATNRDLLTEAHTGRFRQDLYYRLSVFPIEIPPLRDRPEDIGPLMEHFVRQSCERVGVPPPGITKGHVRVLEQYAWPGNVRELQNVVERAVIISRGGSLQFELGGMVKQREGSPHEQRTRPRTTVDPSLEELKRMERDVIVRALDAAGWKIYGETGAAARLGLPPTTLTSRMKKMVIRKASM